MQSAHQQQQSCRRRTLLASTCFALARNSSLGLRALPLCISAQWLLALGSNTSKATLSHSSDGKFEQLIWEMDISLTAQLMMNGRFPSAFTRNTNEL